ncbi:hypothetical protein ABID25_005231 [Mesorhizobium abyssinicae]
MAAKRPEGVVAREAPTLALAGRGAGVLREATPSVAFGDISPTRGEIIAHSTRLISSVSPPLQV